MTPLIHHARWIMVEPGHFVENGCVVVLKNRILAVNDGLPKSTEGGIRDHGDGILMPALVNAHTHVALSDASRGNASRGFISWVECLIKARREQTPEAAEQTVRNGIEALKISGSALVGDFGPHIPVAQAFQQAGIESIVWMEYLGNDRELSPLPADLRNVRHAFAGHAPHTASPVLLKRIQKADNRLRQRFCFHLAESREELEFLQKGTGGWADFMTRMGIDFSSWSVFGKRPVEMALAAGLLDQNTVAVHLLEINEKEMKALAETGAHVVLCPRSNSLLHKKMPDIEGFLKAGIQPALGTDSLASTPTLSLLDEMRFVHRCYPGMNPDFILRMGTVNGARALGYSDVGSLRPGNRSPLIHVNINVKDAKEIGEALLSLENFTLNPVF